MQEVEEEEEQQLQAMNLRCRRLRQCRRLRLNLQTLRWQIEFAMQTTQVMQTLGRQIEFAMQTTRAMDDFRRFNLRLEESSTTIQSSTNFRIATGRILQLRTDSGPKEKISRRRFLATGGEDFSDRRRRDRFRGSGSGRDRFRGEDFADSRRRDRFRGQISKVDSRKKRRCRDSSRRRKGYAEPNRDAVGVLGFGGT